MRESTGRDANITNAINGAFDFLSDVEQEPTVLDRIPDGSTIAFREINIQDHAFRFAASRRPPLEEWRASISGYSYRVGAPAIRRQLLDQRSQLHAQVAMLRTFAASGATADGALDGLEQMVRDAIADGIARPDQAIVTSGGSA